MDGSSVSSPLESPEAPITSSVVTLQSAESLSIRRQVRLANEALDTTKPQIQNQISLDKTPDTPSAKISLSSSEVSHAFTSNFVLDSGLTSLQIHHQISLDKTPDTPSAYISSRSSSELSQAFTSQFAPENSPNTIPEESSPSALITPSTEFFPDDSSDRFNYISFGDEPFDVSQFDYDLSCFNTDGMSQKSESWKESSFVEIARNSFKTFNELGMLETLLNWISSSD